ncbi:MAG: ABC transporter permease, partial [Anaerolineales bacterium]
MSPSEFLLVAWESIYRNKTRSLLTMLGIIIGVAAVIIMIGISAGTEAAIEDEITGLGTNLVFVNSTFSRGGSGAGTSGMTGGLVYDDGFAIADEVTGVAGVTIEQGSVATIKAGGVVLDEVSILGTTPDFPSVRDMDMDTGRYFKQQEVDQKQKIAVLGSSLAEELFGDADPIGQVITV